jgi:hypothetical protein
MKNMERLSESFSEIKPADIKSHQSIKPSGTVLGASQISQEQNPKSLVQQPSLDRADSIQTFEDRETRTKIAEGILAMRANAAEFMAAIRKTRPLTTEFCGQLFARCIMVYSQYKPLFEPVIKSSDPALAAERQAINDERNFVNNSNAEFINFKKGIINVKTFLDKLEQLNTTCENARRGSYLAPEILSEMVKTPKSQNSFQHFTTEIRPPSEQKLDPIFQPNSIGPRKEFVHNDIASRHSSKRPSIHLQSEVMNTSIHSGRFEKETPPKQFENFFTTAPNDRSINDDKISPQVKLNTSQDNLNSSNFFKNQNQPSKENLANNSEFFDFSKSPGKKQVVVGEKDPFAAFQFPSQTAQPDNNQEFFSNNSQIREHLTRMEPEKPATPGLDRQNSKSIEQSPPQASDSKYFSNGSADNANKSLREQAFGDGKGKSLNESSHNLVRINSLLMGKGPSTIMPTSKAEPIRSTSSKRMQSNVLLGGKRVSFVDSIVEESSHRNDSSGFLRPNASILQDQTRMPSPQPHRPVQHQPPRPQPVCRVGFARPAPVPRGNFLASSDSVWRPT